MKLTCLSKGGSFQFPPCHMVNICGFRILLDCPVDLSALTIFSPVPTCFDSPADKGTSDCPIYTSLDTEAVSQKREKIENPLDASNLIQAEPWFKTVKSLHLWDVSFIDIVLISSPMGMLGLPFLTKNKGFSAKIYVTEATAKIAQLMMEDLISMHMEYRQLYGNEESGYPQWMNWEELERLPSAIREIALGNDIEDLGCWMPLYSVDDVQSCLRKVQTLKYAEEACYNGILIIKAFSSGLEVGSCNWTINSPKRNITCISGSIFVSPHAMDFDFHALRGNDLILYSDFSPLYTSEDLECGSNCSIAITNNFSTLSGDNNWEELAASLLDQNESLEEMEKLAFICSCAIDSIKAGGSVLVTISRLGITLQLLEMMAVFLESSSLNVPIYVISSVAEELLAYANSIPEWLCKQRQEKLFSGEALFAHVELIRGKRVHLFPTIHSPTLLKNWQESCIIFSPHWSLRLGPSVHLLRHWCQDPRSLLVLENGVDASLALLPFKPMAMKVLQCSFLSGIRLQKVEPLLRLLQPKLVLFPDNFRQLISLSDLNSNSVSHYTENEMLRVPSFKDCSEVEIAIDLASEMRWKEIKKKSINATRLKGELLMHEGQCKLFSGLEPTKSRQLWPLVLWGSPNLERLQAVLLKMGISGTVEQVMGDDESKNSGIICVHSPNQALIEVQATSTLINAANENLASRIFEAISSILDGI